MHLFLYRNWSGEKKIQGTEEKEGKLHVFLERERSNTQKQQVTAVAVVTTPQTRDHLYGFQPFLSAAFNPTLTPSEPPLSSKMDAHRFLQLQKTPWGSRGALPKPESLWNAVGSQLEALVTQLCVHAQGGYNPPPFPARVGTNSPSGTKTLTPTTEHITIIL